jgi:YgiT-type zinc finger domain-containing protein
MTVPDDQASPPQEGRQDSQAAPACACCGAETHEDLVKAAFWGPQGLVAIEDIPARVCAGCGEQFYADQTAQRIEEIVNGATAVPVRQITVPVFSLADAQAPERNS